jgi:coenzyme Q-binding protein COQ10
MSSDILLHQAGCAMSHYTRRLIVPYSAADMYDLAADVEHYPDFLDGWRAVRVLATHGDTRTVEQVLGFGPLRWRFRSYASGDPPRRLQIRSEEAPFRRLWIDWQLRDLPSGGAEVMFEATCELRSSQVDRLASSLLEASFSHTVDAFERRARTLYGPSPGSPGGPA